MNRTKMHKETATTDNAKIFEIMMIHKYIYIYIYVCVCVYVKNIFDYEDGY
jgi:hypothetical protein